MAVPRLRVPSVPQSRVAGAGVSDEVEMDSTYASSLAILRRIFTLEGAPAPSRGG
jgi:hypothetical protein